MISSTARHFEVIINMIEVLLISKTFFYTFPQCYFAATHNLLYATAPVFLRLTDGVKTAFCVFRPKDLCTQRRTPYSIELHHRLMDFCIIFHKVFFEKSGVASLISIPFNA